MTTATTPAMPTALPDAAPVVAARSVRILRIVLALALVAAFGTTSLLRGLPTDRLVLLGWVLTGLAVHSTGRGIRPLVRLLTDWVPLAAVLVLYDVSRGLADGFGVAVHVTEPVAFDRWLTGGVLPTAWLQEHWSPSWWMALSALVYSSHFVVTPVVLGLLWLRDRARWVRYVRLVVVLSAAGLLTYVVYPAAPPWLAARHGIVEPVQRLSGVGWEVLGMPRAGALLSAGQGQVNPVAAVPSLHTAFAVLTCLVLLPVARRAWQRVGLVGYALLMPLVLVWSGEHYVIDTVLGAAYAVAVCLLVPRAGVLARWHRSGRPVTPATVPATVAPDRAGPPLSSWPRGPVSVTGTTSSGPPPGARPSPVAPD